MPHCCCVTVIFCSLFPALLCSAADLRPRAVPTGAPALQAIFNQAGKEALLRKAQQQVLPPREQGQLRQQQLQWQSHDEQQQRQQQQEAARAADVARQGDGPVSMLQEAEATAAPNSHNFEALLPNNIMPMELSDLPSMGPTEKVMLPDINDVFVKALEDVTSGSPPVARSMDMPNSLKAHTAVALMEGRSNGSAQARAEAAAKEAAEAVSMGSPTRMERSGSSAPPQTQAASQAQAQIPHGSHSAAETSLRQAAEELFGLANSSEDEMAPLPDMLPSVPPAKQVSAPTHVPAAALDRHTLGAWTTAPPGEDAPMTLVAKPRANRPSSKALAKPMAKNRPATLPEPVSEGSGDADDASVDSDTLPAEAVAAVERQVTKQAGELAAAPVVPRPKGEAAPPEAAAQIKLSADDALRQAQAAQNKAVQRAMAAVAAVKAITDSSSNESTSPVLLRSPASVPVSDLRSIPPMPLQTRITAVPVPDSRHASGSYYRIMLVSVVLLGFFATVGLTIDSRWRCGLGAQRKINFVVLRVEELWCALVSAFLRNIEALSAWAATQELDEPAQAMQDAQPQQQWTPRQFQGQPELQQQPSQPLFQRRGMQFAACSPDSASPRSAVNPGPGARMSEPKAMPSMTFLPAHPSTMLKHAGLPFDDTKLIIPLAPLRLLEWSIEILGPHGVPLLHAHLRHQRSSGSGRRIEVSTLGVVGTTLAVATDDFQLTSTGGVSVGQIQQEEIAVGWPGACAMSRHRCEVRSPTGAAAMRLEFDDRFWLERVVLPSTGALLASVMRRSANVLIHNEHLELSVTFGVDSSLLLAILLAVTTFGLPRVLDPLPPFVLAAQHSAAPFEDLLEVDASSYAASASAQPGKLEGASHSPSVASSTPEDVPSAPSAEVTDDEASESVVLRPSPQPPPPSAVKALVEAAAAEPPQHGKIEPSSPPEVPPLPVFRPAPRIPDAAPES